MIIFVILELIIINFPNFLVNREHYFKDKYLFYRFTINDKWRRRKFPNDQSWESQLDETISLLAQISPDANLRLILRKT